jgi:3-dehydroquinate synthase
VRFVQVPTTLLAMVDSSVGGKTGVNTRHGKNLVGAFHQPVYVHAALRTLSTLPERERISGLGEVVKTALIDGALLAEVETHAEALRTADPDVLLPVIARCVAIKASIVAEDEREAGRRAVLNRGHTDGHGLEAALDYRMLHGEAVAVGLLAECSWAVRRGICLDPSLPDRLRALLSRLGLPTTAPPVSAPAVLDAMRLDKKASGGNLRLPVAVGAGSISLTDVPAASWPELLGDIV